MKQSIKFKIGDKVLTKTHGVYQSTQESLSGLTVTIKNIEDEYNIHVLLDNKPHFDGAVGFSEIELTKII